MHPSFDNAALRCEGTSIRLLASQCSRCENISFPCRERCAKCYAPASQIELAESGTVLSHCTAAFPIAGVQPPVTIAQVRIGDADIEILGVSTGPVRIGDVVSVVPRTASTEDALFTTYGFEKESRDA
ncbi:hypothetical protein BKP42_50720 [Rhodococcus erythropolis]|nr:hypothetical protein BKP42_50720 [Rhodococcus erythropolis]